LGILLSSPPTELVTTPYGIYYYYYYYYYLTEQQMGFPQWQWYYIKTQHTKIHISHKITHHAKKKHNTQSYTNNKGHITHNEYSTEIKAIPVTGRGGL
jgi:hypothetical protein